MIKVSDYIIQRLVDYGVKDVFMISGGGAMHLNDSVGRNKNIQYICNHHEQASAIAAEGYARASGKLAVVIVTSGPGGTNTITGVIGQWLDSVPVLYISGQVKRETTIASCPDIPLRQLGDQEINIVDIVRSVTKYAAQIVDPLKVKWYLDKAVYLATHGRPGPVWLDIPLDVQGALVDEEMLYPSDSNFETEQKEHNEIQEKVRQTIQLLKAADRPVILAGHGIRIAKALDYFKEFVKKTGIPVVSSLNGCDLIATDHPCFIGRIGTIGSRAGNFAIQNADFLLSIGSRNNIRQIGYNWEMFARDAIKVIIDIDPAELQKPTVIPNLAIQADARDFLQEINQQLSNQILPNWNSWKNWCTKRKEKYPTLPPEYMDANHNVNPYLFIKRLSENMADDAVIVAGNGTACISLFQAVEVKEGQRIIWNSGCAAMGYDLPAAIGACFANRKKAVICLAGDGSLQMNIQELQTIKHHNLPIKLFVLNNDGYISIRQTQENLFNRNYVACDSSCGISFPNLANIAEAYGLAYEFIDHNDGLEDKIIKILADSQAVICEVLLDTDYKFSPKASSMQLPDGTMVSRSLEDMAPFLDRGEFTENIIIK